MNKVIIETTFPSRDLAYSIMKSISDGKSSLVSGGKWIMHFNDKYVRYKYSSSKVWLDDYNYSIHIHLLDESLDNKKIDEVGKWLVGFK